MSDADCVGLWPIDQSTCDVCTHSESSQDTVECSSATRSCGGSVEQQNTTKKKIVEKKRQSFLRKDFASLSKKKNDNKYLILLTRQVVQNSTKETVQEVNVK